MLRIVANRCERVKPKEAGKSAYFCRFLNVSERGRTSSWRRGRDSNPRYGYPYAAFRVRCFQPLSHLSVAAKGTNIPVGRRLCIQREATKQERRPHANRSLPVVGRAQPAEELSNKRRTSARPRSPRASR